MNVSVKLKKLIPKLIPLHYHPPELVLAKGGYSNKLKILRYFQEF